MHLGSPKSLQEVGGDPGASKPKTCRIFKKQPLQQANFVDPKTADLGNVSGFFEQLTKPNNVEKTVAKVHLSPMQTGQGAGQRVEISYSEKRRRRQGDPEPHFCLVNTHLFDIGFRPTEFSQILILVSS